MPGSPRGEWSATLAMADARVAAGLAVLLDAADQISESEANHRVTGRWSAAEHMLFEVAVERGLRRWVSIARHVVTRTVRQVRTHAVRTRKRGARAEGESGASEVGAGRRPSGGASGAVERRSEREGIECERT